jgi:nucleoside-diphosphate-sugar epimerase
MDKLKILITGGNGYIARSLRSALSEKYDITSITRQDFDLTDDVATSEFFKGNHFDVVIHTAVSGGSRLKVDNDTTILDNISMFWNLLDNQDHFNRFITFGSGAEIYNSKQPYGLSKKVIANAMRVMEGCYNLRVYAVFDENELDTRFIKGNITRYIEGEDMIIHQDKYMDFFYMKDLVSLVDYYITAVDPIQTMDCCYLEKYKLSDIAGMINRLNKYRIGVVVGEEDLGVEYTGNYVGMPIRLIGLEQGIRNVYSILK